jgi:DNA gyrase subunit A
MELDIDQSRKMLVITENGFGKRTPLDEYRLQARGGKGVATYDKTKFAKTGLLVGATLVSEDDEVMVINSNGVIIRIRANEVSTSGRTTQGVKVMKVDGENRIVAFAKVVDEESAEKPSGEDEEVPAEENVTETATDAAEDQTVEEQPEDQQ